MDNDILFDVTTLGGGCFWCIEAIFELLNGVEKIESGYSGGHIENPTYHQVSSGNTGHVEVVQIHFNPKVISFKDLLKIFFTYHNPTTKNRQGNDIGPQYRSIILYHSEDQKTDSEESIKEIEKEKIWKNPIVTEIAEFSKFYVAEDFHQEYYRRNQGDGYCQVIIEPKVAKFRKEYIEKLKK